uniref:Uncharacterized protein n=1 Tax=Panstrongylus lignarius TaxID=156445 RepID=A0A224XYM3_9HEMI
MRSAIQLFLSSADLATSITAGGPRGDITKAYFRSLSGSSQSVISTFLIRKLSLSRYSAVAPTSGAVTDTAVLFVFGLHKTNTPSNKRTRLSVKRFPFADHFLRKSSLISSLQYCPRSLTSQPSVVFCNSFFLSNANCRRIRAFVLTGISLLIRLLTSGLLSSTCNGLRTPSTCFKLSLSSSKGVSRWSILIYSK